MSTTVEDPASHDAVIAAARAKLRAQVGPIHRQRGGIRIPTRVLPTQDRDGDKVKNVLKKLNLQPIGTTDEVILHRADSSKALIFKGPKVQLSPHNNTTVVSGPCVEGEVPIDDIFTSRMLRQIAGPAAQAAVSAAKDEDDGIPTLVEDFEAVAEQVVDAAAASAKIEEVD
eukprot:Blabericola_migrator_1__4153@NODE_226_length_11123_cov_75_892547_g192_i0_p6_GENE_NODE_226_length_11123_cov_75_892547_g192_i0NODE_226_length_11123_cov_75_892547_g192_i0_p6_ORF_typecomplete_len171_score48_23NAC/PF01849_18/3_2e10_NODE_226_length_11123_cov_75_892547_g192_i024032915